MSGRRVVGEGGLRVMVIGRWVGCDRQGGEVMMGGG